jgi:HEAT repeat protein
MKILGACLMGVLALGALARPAQEEGDPRRRARTARDLSRDGAAAIPRLAAMLSDPVLEVRVEAVKSLVEIDTQYSLDPLITATRDADAEVQVRATDGLVNFYLPGYVRTGLTASLRRVGSAISARFTDTTGQVIDPHVQVRPEVIEALGELARTSSSFEARANAARAAGILRGGAAIPKLVEAIRTSKNDQVIFEALIALQKIRDPAAAPGITFLLKDLNEKIQIAALETTGLLRNREALPRMCEALDRARSQKVRRASLSAIAMIPEEENRALYDRYLEDRDEWVRAAALEGLARLKNPADLPRIEKVFQEERRMSARLSAAFAVVALGKTEVSEFSPLQYLVNTLNSSGWRGVVRAFLIELAREPQVRAPLNEATRRGTRDEKVSLAQILARSGEADTLPFIEALTKDADVEVAREAIDALRTLRSRLP